MEVSKPVDKSKSYGKSVPRRIVFLGPPGAGKGTQAESISKALSVVSISTGEMIRDALKSGSELGKKVSSYIEVGTLVPDDVVIDIVKDRISKDDCNNGFILDGFPRTIPQAEALDKMNTDIQAVISLEVSDDTIIERMSGRRVCKQCQATYHTKHKKPTIEDICDKCRGTLVQREDDKPEIVKQRLKVYHEQTKPLKDYYKNQGKLLVVEGQEKVEDTKKLVFEALGVRS